MCELVIKTALRNGDYKYNYIVWVGGCDDHYIYYEDAKRDYDYWISNGYNDVIIEKID
jgi:hypothetical protein